MGERECPGEDANDVQREKQEDGCAKQDNRRGNVGTAGAQTEIAAFMKSKNPMDAGAVEEHEADENDRADDNGGGEGELNGDLTQVICWA